MKLIDLDPHWFVLEQGAQRVGISFDCPHCRKVRIGVPFHHAAPASIDEDKYILAHGGMRTTGNQIWTITGDDFATLSLSPSVDASKSGHWHGFITNGEIR